MDLSPAIVFRCDGSPEIGLGHVIRCLALGDELNQQYGCSIIFLMREGPLGFEVVAQHGYPIVTIPVLESTDDYANWLNSFMQHHPMHVLVLDVRDDLPRKSVQVLRNQHVLIVTLDDPTERRLHADLAFYPPIPQVQKMDWDGFSGRVYSGWEWVPLRKEFALGASRGERECPVILITMGGTDPAGLTLKAVAALDQLDEDFDALIVLGAGFCHDEALDAQLKKMRHPFSIRRNVTNMSDLMSQADLAIASFGTTAYELAAMRVPGVYLGLTDDHVESASAFMNAGIGVCLGQFENVDEKIITLEMKNLLRDKSRRLEMTRRAGQTVDGMGVQRIAEKIMYGWKHRHVTDSALATS